MKNNRLITITVLFLICALFFQIPSSAQLLTVDMSHVGDHDTIYTCDYYWGIQGWPDSRATENHTWIISYQTGNTWLMSDTIYADTIGINDYFKEGSISYYGYNGENYYDHWVEVRKLALNASYSGGTCNSTLELHASTNYQGSATFSWAPAEFLSDPHSANPSAVITGNTNFTVTITVPSGCTVTKEIEVLVDAPSKPSICMVSVDSITNKNILYWQNPSESGLDSVIIYKETDVTGQYRKIGELSINNPGYFVDTNSNPPVQSNKYKIALLDSCFKVSELSDSHKTIHLAINQGMNNGWNLIWEPYEGFEVSTYRIYRGIDGGPLELIGTTSGSSNQYTDFSAPDGYLNYQIEVINPSSCNIGGLKSTESLNNRSRSNIASNQSTILHIIKLYNSYSVYPNPFTDELNIESAFPIKNGYIEVAGMDGRVIRRMDFSGQRYKADTSGLKPGSYILSIYSGDAVDTFTVVKR